MSDEKLIFNLFPLPNQTAIDVGGIISVVLSKRHLFFAMIALILYGRGGDDLCRRIMAEQPHRNKGSPLVQINLNRAGLSRADCYGGLSNTHDTVKCHWRNVVINMSVIRGSRLIRVMRRTVSWVFVQ